MTDPREEPEMEALEALLRQELSKPVPLPEGFTERLLARVAIPQKTARPVTRPVRWQAVAALAALVAVLGAICGAWQGRQVKHHTAVQAQQQLILACRITSNSLHHAGQRIELQLAQTNPRMSGTERREEQ